MNQDGDSQSGEKLQHQTRAQISARHAHFIIEIARQLEVLNRPLPEIADKIFEPVDMASYYTETAAEALRYAATILATQCEQVLGASKENIRIGALEIIKLHTAVNPQYIFNGMTDWAKTRLGALNPERRREIPLPEPAVA